MKTNRAIYEAAGAYFVCNRLSLQEAHAVPNDTEMREVLRVALTSMHGIYKLKKMTTKGTGTQETSVCDE
jgi:hypothetical protein